MAVNGIDEGGPDNSDGVQYYKLLSGKRSPANGLKHQTQAPNASTNGGDAFGVCARLHVYVLMDDDKLETLLKLNAIKAFDSQADAQRPAAVKGLNCVSLFV